jgi:hypothetical protein
VYYPAGDQSLVSWETVPFPSGYNHADACKFLFMGFHAIPNLVSPRYIKNFLISKKCEIEIKIFPIQYVHQFL